MSYRLGCRYDEPRPLWFWRGHRMTKRSGRSVTIAPRDQERIWLIARIDGNRPSAAAAAAMRLYYQLHEYHAIEVGYDDPELSPYAEQLCELIGFTPIDEDGKPAIPAHRRRSRRRR